MGTQLSPEKRHIHPHLFFGPCLLRPNGCMDQDATCYRGKPQSRRRCVRWGRSFPLKRAQPPVFGSCLLWSNGWMDEDATWYGSRPRPRRHCIRRGPSSPQQRPPSFRPMSIMATVVHLSYHWALVCFSLGNLLIYVVWTINRLLWIVI